MTEKRYDLVLLGATGYTGGLALSYLAGLSPEARGSVAVAGRDPRRLAATCERLAPGLDVPVLTADATDPGSLARLASKTRVLLHLAGPYTQRGPAVVQACVEHGAHYVDLTGEPLFIRDMIAAHHVRARERGVRIVHSCGYESLPFDMLSLLAADALHGRHGVLATRVELSAQMKVHDRAVLRDAAFSRGTVATIQLLLADTRGAQTVDAAVLLPPDADPDAARARHPRASGARRDPFDGSWATPVYPAPTLNPQIILRSAALLGGASSPYAPDFRYRESASMVGTVDGPMQRAGAVAMAGAIDMVMHVIERGSPWQRRLLSRVAGRLGGGEAGGPRHALLARFDYTLRARATGPGGETVTATWDALGNPGYLSTAKMVVQAGLALAQDGPALPAQAGVLTPSTALGTAFAARLPAADITLLVQ